MSTTLAEELVKDWQSLLTDAMEASREERLARLPFGDVFLEGCHRASLWMAATIGLRGVVAITSLSSHDGRPPVAAGLARALVRNVSGRVILADLDFGRGGQSQLFGVALRPGLGECLAYASSPRLVPEEPAGRLWLLPAGGRSTFTSNRLIDLMVAGRLLEALRELFTFVVLDLPPLEEAPEIVPRLNGIVDGYVLVGRYRGTHVRALRAAAALLSESRRPVGLVMADDRSRIPRWVGKFLDWTSASAVAETPATSVPAESAISREWPASAAAPEVAAQPWVGKLLDWTSASAVAETPATPVLAESPISRESPASAAAPEDAAQAAVRSKRHQWVSGNPWQLAAAFASVVCVIGFAAIVMHPKQLPPGDTGRRPSIVARAAGAQVLESAGAPSRLHSTIRPSATATPIPAQRAPARQGASPSPWLTPAPTPTPTPAPTPAPTPTPSPTPRPGLPKPSPAPTPTPTPTPRPALPKASPSPTPTPAPTSSPA